MFSVYDKYKDITVETHQLVQGSRKNTETLAKYYTNLYISKLAARKCKAHLQHKHKYITYNIAYRLLDIQRKWGVCDVKRGSQLGAKYIDSLPTANRI